MKYRYEDLSDQEFENLTIAICNHLFGTGVQGFAIGPDGGRDGKFVGIADEYPSKSAPWKGITIIQAKHTNSYNKKFSDKDFFSETNQSCVIAKEIPKIRKMREEKGIDHYILFSNRNLGSNINEKIISHISKECNIPQSDIRLVGVEDIERFVDLYPKVHTMAHLESVNAPLTINQEELAELVDALAKQKDSFSTAELPPPVERISYEAKNKANEMTADYARAFRKYNMGEVVQIERFLAMPGNEVALEAYETAKVELELKIAAWRGKYENFDHVLEHVFDDVFKRDPILSRNKRLTRAVVFYMYWNCDIGRETDVTTQ